MVDEKLLEYIRETKKKGYLENQIKEHLIKHGYTDEIVQEAFKIIERKKEYVGEKHHHYFIIVILVAILIGGLVFVIIKKMPGNCKSKSLEVYESYDDKLICKFSNEQKIQMILKNAGTEQISKINVVIIGDQGKLKLVYQDIDLASDSLYSKIVESDYETVGNIESIEIVPDSCMNKKLNVESIPSCE